MNQFAQEYASKGVVVIGVSIDKNPKLYQRFLSQMHVAFDTARDPDADIAGSYGTFRFRRPILSAATGKCSRRLRMRLTGWIRNF